MGVFVEFIGVVVPRRNLAELKPYNSVENLHRTFGGKFFGKTWWYSDSLLYLGTMSSRDTLRYVAKLEEAGLEPTETRDGETYWKDLAVVSADGIMDHKCPWLEYNVSSRVASLKGESCGPVCGPRGRDLSPAYSISGRELVRLMGAGKVTKEASDNGDSKK